MIFEQSFAFIVEAKLCWFEWETLRGPQYILDEAHFTLFRKIINPNPARLPLIVVLPFFKHFIVL